MARIIFTDGIGPAVLHNGKPAPANRFSSWRPSPMPFGDKATRQSDGALTRIRLRDDFGATFDLAGIPVARQKTNLIEQYGDIVTLGSTPTNFSLTAPNLMVGVLAGLLNGAPGDVGYNGAIAKHTRDTGTVDTNVGGYAIPVTNAHHLTASVWVYIPTNPNITSVSFKWEANVGSVVQANANMALRDQWQLLTSTATATASATSNPILRMVATTGQFIYSDAWSASDGDDGLYTRMVDIADRLVYHLENGGQCQVDTGDVEGNGYTTCGLAPGATAQPPTLSDRKLVEYTLSLALVNLAGSPARMRCHYL